VVELELGGTTTVVLAGGGGLLLLMQPASIEAAIAKLAMSFTGFSCYVFRIESSNRAV
jgi:hypothetical protein